MTPASSRPGLSAITLTDELADSLLRAARTLDELLVDCKAALDGDAPAAAEYALAAAVLQHNLAQTHGNRAADCAMSKMLYTQLLRNWRDARLPLPPPAVLPDWNGPHWTTFPVAGLFLASAHDRELIGLFDAISPAWRAQIRASFLLPALPSLPPTSPGRRAVLLEMRQINRDVVLAHVGEVIEWGALEGRPVFSDRELSLIGAALARSCPSLKTIINDGIDFMTGEDVLAPLETILKDSRERNGNRLAGYWLKHALSHAARLSSSASAFEPSSPAL